MLLNRNLWLKRLLSFLIGYLIWEWLIDPMRFLSWIEEQVHNNTGYYVDIERVEHRWYRPGKLKIYNVNVASEDDLESARIKEIHLSVAVKHLFKRKLIIERLVIDSPHVVYHHPDDAQPEQDRQFQTEPRFSPWSVQLNTLKISSADMTLHQPEQTLRWREGNLTIRDFYLPSDTPIVPENLRVAVIAEGVLDYPPFSTRIEKLESELNEGMLNVAAIQLSGEELTLDAHATVQLSDPTYPTEIGISNSLLTFTDALKSTLPSGVQIDGHLQSEAQLRLLAEQDPLSSAAGSVSIQSDDLVVSGIDLDNLFDGLIEAESTSLMDVGSFLLTGPVGLIASQVVSLGESGLTTGGGQTPITGLNIDVDIDKGIVTTQDVAFSTHHHLVNFDGQIDAVDHIFRELHFYLLDDENCVLVDQTLNGQWDAPEGLAGALASTTVIKPFTNILEKAGKLLTKCEPVYQGKVAFPSPDKTPG